MDRKTLSDPSGRSFRTNAPSSSTPQFCQLCRDLSDWFVTGKTSCSQDIDPNVSFAHHQSWHELQDAASDGCHLCFQFALEAEDRAVGTTIAYKIASGASTAFSMYLDREKNEISVRCERVKWCTIVVTASCDDPMLACGLRTSVDTPDINPTLACTLFKVKAWMHECRSTHVDCREVSDFIPTRLIEIDSADVPIRLVDTNAAIDVDGLQYATLSHCWGQTEHLTTTLDTLKQRHAGIELSDLNKTFQDAILIGRALEIKYIWIDSLCIIQDSLDDWQRESSLMGSVYRKGIVNIAADAAEDGNQGFITKKAAVHLPYTMLDDSVHGVLRLDIHQERWVEYDGDLRRRGWVLQEYILSPCSIRYNLNTIVWECREQSYSDSKVILEETPMKREKRLAKHFPLQMQASRIRVEDIMTIWRSIVVDYSRKELTRESDILPALSGLASLVKQATGDEYLAGIWRSDIVKGLQWTSVAIDWHSPDSTSPSWSWASCKKYYPVNYSTSSTMQSTFKLLSHGVTIAGVNPLGAVKDGFLTLEGFMRRAIIEPSEPGDSSSIYAVRFARPGAMDPKPICQVLLKSAGARVPDVWCLQLCVKTSAEFSPTNDDAYGEQTYGVMVLEEDTKEENVFRRLEYVYRPLMKSDWSEAVRRQIVLK